MSDARRCYRIAVFAGVFLSACAFGIIAGFKTGDESWFLQVAHRVAHGETLYRDVAFGATPLSVYLEALLLRAFGTQILVSKALIALCFTATVLLSRRTAQDLGMSPAQTALLTAALYLYVLPGMVLTGALYTPLATTLMVACCTVAVRWLVRGEAGATEQRALLLAAGALAGLCFASKQNMGVLALLALVAAVCIAGRPRQLLSLWAAFAITTALALLPVLISGGMSALIDYGFTGKGAYVRFGQISYLSGLAGLLAWPRFRVSGALVAPAYWQHQFLIAPLTALALLLALRNTGEAERPRVILLMLFWTAAFLGVFPRADPIHLTIAHPLLLLGLVYACSHLHVRPGLARMVMRAASVWLGIGLVGMTAALAYVLSSDAYVVSPFPHFRGTIIKADRVASAAQAAAALNAAAADRELLLVSGSAGFYYLITGLRNPTRYDYPFVTTFGRRGEAQVAEAVAAGEIRAACIDATVPPELRARTLEAAIRAHLRHMRDNPLCAEYRLM
jgi:hypothetical protein